MVSPTAITVSSHRHTNLTMAVRIFSISLFLLISSLTSFAQIKVGQGQQVDKQRQIDEKLARDFFYKKEYDKAKELYYALYSKYDVVYYFNQYVECLTLTGDYDTAEKTLRSFLKKNPTNWKSHVSLAYVYSQTGESEKAMKYLTKVLKDVPATKTAITEVAANLRNKGFNEMAVSLYDAGAKNPKVNYDFFLEKAYTYYSILDFKNATDNFLLYLNANPGNYDMVKDKFRIMMRYDINGSVNDIIRTALLKKNQEQPDNEDFASLLMWFSLQTEDYELALMLLTSLDKRVGSHENDILYIAQIALDNRLYDIALQAYEYVVNKSEEGAFFIDAEIGYIKAKYLNAIADGTKEKTFFEELSKRIASDLDKIGFYNDTQELISIQANILALELNRYEEAIALLNSALEIRMSNTNAAKIKMQLADIYLFVDNVWEASLLYSQIEKTLKNDPVAHEAKFKNAQLRYFIGEFEWATAALDILKSATSKLIANDAMTLSLTISDMLEYDTVALHRLALADYRIFQRRYEEADKILDSIIAYNPNEVSLPNVFFRKAKSAASQGDFISADSLYKRVYQGYTDCYLADEALMQDAFLLENMLNKKDEAMDCFARLFDYYTASVYVAQARNNYRRLRDEKH
ncbi:MAG: tetratricopeptide repeat protein [Candidatus Limimorpha sp.]